MLEYSAHMYLHMIAEQWMGIIIAHHLVIQFLIEVIQFEFKVLLQVWPWKYLFYFIANQFMLVL